MEWARLLSPCRRLPSPRFWDSLNVTNGSASLHLIHTATDTYVRLESVGNVSFSVRSSYVGTSLDTRVTHASSGPSPSGGLGMNVTLELATVAPGTTVRLDLSLGLESFCASFLLDLHTTVSAGSGGYPAEWHYLPC